MSLERFSKYIKDVTVLQRMIFAVGNLPPELPNLWSIVVEFGVAGKEKMDTIKPDEARILLQNLADINKEALEMTKDRRLFLELINFHFEGNTPSQSLGVILMSSRQNCLKCNTPLTIRTDRPSRLIIYDDVLGSLPGTHYHKYCRRAKCYMHQYYGYHTIGDSREVFYDNGWESLPYFISSQLTAFSTRFLASFDADLLIGQVSYKQKADMYNYIHQYNMNKQESQMDVGNGFKIFITYSSRQSLDRRRLEDGHMRYAVLKVVSWYGEKMSPQTFPILPSVNETLATMTMKYYSNFTTKYSAHHCDVAGCHTTLVIDGNMKNHRDVCKAKDAGYVEFEGLQGAIKTGCMKTPAFNSRFCELHRPRAILASTGGTAAEKDQPGPSYQLPPDSGGSPVIKFIAGKRTTRSGVYYQAGGRAYEETTLVGTKKLDVTVTPTQETNQFESSEQLFLFKMQLNHCFDKCVPTFGVRLISPTTGDEEEEVSECSFECSTASFRSDADPAVAHMDSSNAKLSTSTTETFSEDRLILPIGKASYFQKGSFSTSTLPALDKIKVKADNCILELLGMQF